MNIYIHKCTGKTTTDLLEIFNDVVAKDITIISLNEQFISVSKTNPKTQKQLTKKELQSFIDAGFKDVVKDKDHSILVYNGK